MKIESFSQTSIDSLKIYLPFDEIKIIDETITDPKYIISAISGEIIDEFKSNNKPIKINGCSTKFAISKITDFVHKTPQKILVIEFNSKLLGELYFVGINIYTIREIYEKLQDMNVAEFTFRQFLKAKFLDADVKKDFLQKQEDYDHELKFLKEITIPTTNRNSGVYHHPNGGQEWGQRANKDYIKSPYLKIYSKSKELKTRSKEFMGIYLMKFLNSKTLQWDNLRRMEATIKNGKHFKDITGRNNRLIDLLQSIRKEPDAVFLNHFKKRYIKPERIRIMKEISPTEKTLLDTLRFMKENGYSDYQILERNSKLFEHREEKRRQRNLILKLLSFPEDTIPKSGEKFVSIFDKFLT